MTVSVQQLKKTYYTPTGDRLVALDKVDFVINKGEFVALVGPSGCGKSTLLNIIAGLDQTSEGKATINGIDVNKPGPDKAVVFQESALFPWMTVLENVSAAIQGANSQEKMEKASSYLDIVHLGKFKNAYPHQLSGGMKQRVSIARALATESELLLMDEPFAALDEQTRMMLQIELSNIWDKTKKTVIFVTHNIREAVYLADRIFLFSSRPGKIIKEFSVSFERPRVLNSMSAVGMEVEILACLKEEMEKVVKEEIGEEYQLETGNGIGITSGNMGRNL